MIIKICYIRNSRLKQENSVSTQKQLINDFCNTHNITLDKIIVDEGISGNGDKTNKREGYLWVMNKIEMGEIDTVIVISISRRGSKLAFYSVDHHSAEIFAIAVIVNFVSLPLISSVKSSSIFFPTMAWPKGEW